MKALLAICVLAGIAHAETKADQLFKQGKLLLDKKRYAEACKAFEDSFALEPGLGAQLNIAHCYEEWGRLATALELYKRAEQIALDKKDPRLPKVRERLEAVEPQVPRLTVHVTGDAAGAEVVVDGKPAKADAEMLVDPGPHTVEVRRGTESRSKTVPLEAGASSEVKLEAPGHGTQTATVVDDKPDRTRKLVALGTGGAGVVAILVSGVVTLHAHSKYKDALAGDCMGSTSMCDDLGISATHTARKEANIATGVFVAGAILAGVGAYLYFTVPGGAAKEHAMRVVPSGTGVALTGGF